MEFVKSALSERRRHKNVMERLKNGESPKPDSIPDSNDPEQITIRMTTWNINGQDLPEDITKLLETGSQSRDSSAKTADLYVFGFQEAMKLTVTKIAEDLLIGKARQALCESLKKTIADNLGSGYEYVHGEELVGLYLVVFCESRLSSRIAFWQGAIAACGDLGLGNKGGVAIRFKFADTSMVFVNCHLAASEDNVSRRNDDVRFLVENIRFPDPPQPPSDTAEFEAQGDNTYVKGVVQNRPARTRSPDLARHTTPGIDTSQIFDSDYIFWLGDLNYRIELPHDVVIEAVDAEDFDATYLVKHCQLLQEHKAGHVFQGFHEMEIRFRPTYKLDKGTKKMRYDTSSKQRTPSYTDRILFRTQNGRAIECLEYTSHADQQYHISDHMPVTATFSLEA